MLFLFLLAIAVFFAETSGTETAALILLGAGIVAGVGFSLALRRGRGWVPGVMLTLVLEELFLVGVVAPDPAFSVTRGATFVGASVLAGVLWLRMPLPEGFLPLRGKWLRQALSGAALLGMIQFGPWWMGWSQCWAIAKPVPLQAGLLGATLVMGWLLLETAIHLAVGLPVQIAGLHPRRPAGITPE